MDRLACPAPRPEAGWSQGGSTSYNFQWGQGYLPHCHPMGGTTLMAKLKSQNVVKKRQNQGSEEVDPGNEDCWVVVKKQKITILIPPLPSTEQPIKPKTAADPQIQLKPAKTNSQSTRLAHEREKSILPSPEDLPPANIVHPSRPVLPSKLHHRADFDNILGNGSKSILSKKHMIFTDTNSLISQRMRALYLEKKLQRAGGLNNWLVSLGLGRFVAIFQSRNINKFHLANLTMKKLQDMGTAAVGPRRKLIHAIDCLCQPHCFEYSRGQ